MESLGVAQAGSFGMVAQLGAEDGSDGKDHVSEDDSSNLL